MNVLLLFPMADGQTGPAIKYAFEQLGHTVRAVDAKLRLAYSYEVACGFSPDLVFCSRTPALTDEVIRIKRRFKDAVVCMMNTDTRNAVSEWTHMYPLIKTIDYHFVVGYNQLDEWRKLNVNTYWLPLGLQNEVYDKPHNITEEDRRKYACDVCFCGQVGGPYHSDRMPFLAAIEREGFKLNLWGNRGMPKIYDEEHSKQAALAKVNLGCSSWIHAGRYTSVREYKIMGAAGMLLTRYGDQLEEVFPISGEEQVADSFTTPTDIVEKVRYWLSNEEKRKGVAERGYRWSHGNATYTHRMGMALDYMRDRL